VSRVRSTFAFGGRCIPPPPQRGCRVGDPGGELRCSSLKYFRSSHSSRLAIRAHRRPRCDAGLSPRADRRANRPLRFGGACGYRNGPAIRRGDRAHVRRVRPRRRASSGLIDNHRRAMPRSPRHPYAEGLGNIERGPRFVAAIALTSVVPGHADALRSRLIVYPKRAIAAALTGGSASNPACDVQLRKTSGKVWFLAWMPPRSFLLLPGDPIEL
jgi:hypothetical protein